jgi:hypothetical protein
MSVGETPSLAGGGKAPVVDHAAGGPEWLEEARRAGVSPAAIALGEVRLEMAEALVAGLAGLTARTTDPLASRLADLGLDKPAALLGELPARPDPADRLDGFIKVHQVVGLALVRLAGATAIDVTTLERLPRAESLSIRRPPAVLTPADLIAARLDGRLSRYEAAWHRARHIEALSIDELLTEWPATWSDGDAAPFIADTVTRAGDRAATVAAEILADRAAGLTAQLTAIRVLASIGTPAAMAILKDSASSPAVHSPARARASLAAGPEKRGWLWRVFAGQPAASDDFLDRLTGATDKDTRISALTELEHDVHAHEGAIPVVRQMWRSDPSQDVRAKAAVALGWLGDTESVEGLMLVLRNRASAPKEAKGAVAALALLGDVRAVPEILSAVVDNWAGSLAAEALHRIGVPALEPILALVGSHPELAQRKSLQHVVRTISASPQTGRLLAAHVARALAAPGGADKAALLLKLTTECDALRESVARQILAHVTAPSSKADKALVRAAQQALVKDADKPSIDGDAKP